MRICHTIASIADPNAGPSYSVTALCTELVHLGHDVAVHSVAGWRSDGRDPAQAAAAFETIVHPQDWAGLPIVRSLCLSHAMGETLSKQAGRIDILHTHGLWLMPNIYTAKIAKAHGIPFVISTRGMLGPEALQYSKIKKSVVWALMQRSAFLAADCVHATSEAEAAEVRNAGYRGPIALIPNGVRIPVGAAATSPESPLRRVLSLGRIHPKKGLDTLLDTWNQLGAVTNDWQLVIAGPGEVGYLDKLQQQASSLGLANVEFVGTLDEEQKQQAYADASLFVLPSQNENFGMAIAEALAAGTPVIASKGTPWADLERHRCGWWVDRDADVLAQSLKDAMALSDDARAEMGAKGRAWMERDFAWKDIAARMQEVYKWLRDGGDVPVALHLNDNSS